MKQTIVVILLLSVFVCLAVSSMLQKSGTCDEIAHHIPSGYILLTRGDYKVDTAQPPLARYIVALPLRFFMKICIPADKEQWRLSDRSKFGKDFFFKYNKEPRKILFLSRIMVVLIGVLCGVILFIWARQLYGEKAAILSLFLYSMSPNILAHSSLATTDMIATCFMLLSLYSFWLFTREQSIKNILFAGLSLGLAQLSKYTCILLYPLYITILLFELSLIEKDKRGKIITSLFIVFIVSFLTLWTGYRFEFSPLLKDVLRLEEKIDISQRLLKRTLPFWNERVTSSVNNFLFKVPVPLSSYILGVLGVVRHGQVGHSRFFMGSWSDYGDYLFFVVAFLIKTTIPAMFFMLSGLLISLRKKINRNERYIIITILLFFIVASLSKLQLGIRYILPIYPLLFLIAGRSAELLNKRFFRFVAISFMIWAALITVVVWPNYLSYFNEFAGGPDNGWKYLRDSDIDWGQDLPALARHMRENNVNEITLKYFGQDNPATYGITFRKFDRFEFNVAEKRIYAVSVQSLEEVFWSKYFQPTAKAGKSIFIYDFRKKIHEEE